jgi:hypothetical protein
LFKKYNCLFLKISEIRRSLRERDRLYTEHHFCGKKMRRKKDSLNIGMSHKKYCGALKYELPLGEVQSANISRVEVPT